MKKFYTAALCIISLQSFSQASKWFVSLYAGLPVGGPAASIKHQMTVQGFNQTGSSNFFGFESTTDYPHKTWDAALLVRFGKKITERRSIYFVAGRSEKAEVSGFKNQGYSSFLGIISGSDGPLPSVRYSVYQVTSGFMYSYQTSRATIGLGPSLFFVNYGSAMYHAYLSKSKTSVIPGVSFTSRIPFDKEKKLVGAELVMEANFAPPVKMKVDQGEAADHFHMKSANMLSANIGVALCFRKR